MRAEDAESFDRVADIYDDTRGLPAPVSAQVADRLAAIFREGAPQPRVFEVGIGTGRIALPLSERGVRVAGIDVSPKMLAVLRDKRAPVGAARALAQAPPFAPATFDGALLIHVLHLVPDAAEVVRIALDTVRPGGRFVSGGEDPSSGIWNDAAILLRTLSLRITGHDLGTFDRHLRGADSARRALLDAGARIREETLARWSAELTAGAMLERLRSRTYSTSWAVPDDRLTELVEQATPELERLCGGLDRRHEAPRSVSVIVGELAA